MKNKKLVRGSLLIALALVFQSIRLFFPLPPQINVYIIGSLVHMMLVLALYLNNKLTAVLLSLLLPLTGFIQGQIALPILIPVVIFGNLVFVELLKLGEKNSLGLVVAPICKAICMCMGGYVALKLVGLENSSIAPVVLFAFSVPQIITGVLGIIMAKHLLKILPKESF